jgi:hypothetical protein
VIGCDRRADKKDQREQRQTSAGEIVSLARRERDAQRRDADPHVIGLAPEEAELAGNVAQSLEAPGSRNGHGSSEQYGERDRAGRAFP